MTTKKIIRLVLNVIIVVGALIGIVIDFIEMDTAMVASAFTTQSNMLCVIMAIVTFACLLINRNPVSKLYVTFKGMALTSILLTCLITNFVLKPFMGAHDMAFTTALADTLLHIIIPLLMLVDFVAFETRGSIKFWHPFVWTAFPFYYVAYTAIYRAFGGVYVFGNGNIAKFPYFFLDYETYGFGNVALWFVLIVIGFIGFSYLIFGFDKLLIKLQKDR